MKLREAYQFIKTCYHYGESALPSEGGSGKEREQALSDKKLRASHFYNNRYVM